MVPDEKMAAREDKMESAKLHALTKALGKDEMDSIVQEAYQLKQYQEKPQDQNVLPTLSVEDISRDIEFVDYNTSYISNKVKC